MFEVNNKDTRTPVQGTALFWEHSKICVLGKVGDIADKMLQKVN